MIKTMGSLVVKYIKQKVNDLLHSMSETTTDQISELPESIVFHILSFLPTQSVVQMSILSKRWRYLWKSVPTLDFDVDLFRLKKCGRRWSLIDKNTRFVDFVNKVLQLHDFSHVQRFSISCFDMDMSCLNEWISVAVKRNVQKLILNIRKDFPNLQKDAIELPDSKSLVFLKLVGFYSILSLPSPVCFTSLRSLVLNFVEFSCSFVQLFSSCPALQNLVMVGCRLTDGEVVSISSPTLRKLVLYFVTFSGLKISNNPNLICFQYSCSGKNCFVENLSSLVYATIDVNIHNKYCSTRCKGNRSSLVYETIDGDIDSEYCSKRCTECFHEGNKLLRGVSNARSLVLFDTIIELLNAPDMLESLPTFHNLDALMLTANGKKEHFRVIAYLLWSSPILESLFIKIKPSSNDVYEEEGPESKRFCLEGRLHDHLKEVEIMCFEGTEDELEFVKLLLSNASNMERVTITIKDGLKKITEVSEKLLMFQRASASCIISIS